MEFLEMLFENGAILIAILYFIGAAVFRSLRESKGSDGRPAAPGRGEHSAEDAHGHRRPIITEGEDEHGGKPRSIDPAKGRPPEVQRMKPARPRRKQASALAELSHTGWKRAVILKEILDPPRSRRRGRGAR